MAFDKCGVYGLQSLEKWNKVKYLTCRLIQQCAFFHGNDIGHNVFNCMWPVWTHILRLSNSVRLLALSQLINSHWTPITPDFNDLFWFNEHVLVSLRHVHYVIKQFTHHIFSIGGYSIGFEVASHLFLCTPKFIISFFGSIW